MRESRINKKTKQRTKRRTKRRKIPKMGHTMNLREMSDEELIRNHRTECWDMGREWQGTGDPAVIAKTVDLLAAELLRRLNKAERMKEALIYIAEDDECTTALHELYGLIWVEASYDPTNDETAKFARKLLPHIKKLNDKLGFKQ